MANRAVQLRAKALFPTVLLTLLSIVQALALELMWSHLVDQPYLYELSLLAVLGWLQIITNLLGILLIWLIYSELVLRLRWLPTTIDSLFPFFVGILEFAQISALGPSRLGQWFALFGMLFAAMAWISQLTLKRARRDPDNEEFFADVPPADRRDHLLNAAPVIMLWTVALLLWTTGNQGGWALVAVLVSLSMLLYQIWMNHRYRRRAYGLSDDNTPAG